MTKPKNILAYSLYLLGRRGRTVFELKNKLREKGYEMPEVNSVIQQLEQMGLLDDQQYAQMYARDKVTIYRRGRYRIGLELVRKGVDKELIDEAVSSIPEADELTAAQSLVKARLRQWQNLDPQKRYRRAFGLLDRRGFSPKIIRHILEEIKNKGG